MADDSSDGLQEKIRQKLTSIRQLIERYRTMETYGVDMSNFKYWIECREEEYLVDSERFIDFDESAVKRFAALKRSVALKKSVDDIDALIAPLISVNEHNEKFNAVVEWARNGITLLAEFNKYITDRISSIREELKRSETVALFSKSCSELQIYYLLSNKWLYLLAHAPSKYTIKILRDGLKDVKSAIIAHDEIYNFKSRLKEYVDDVGSNITPDDAVITNIKRIFAIFKRYKKCADASKSAGAEHSIASIIAEGCREMIDSFESPTAKAKHDESIANAKINSKYNRYVIVSGGQTGVDRAALDAARELNYRHGGWLPKGRRTEDGVLGDEYIGMKEMPTDDYIKRTEQNVIDSDRTIVICYGEPEGATKRTVEFCVQHQKPYLVVDLNCDKVQRISAAMKFLEDAEGQRINFAGPRASKAPTIYKVAKNFIENVFLHLEKQKERCEEEK